MATPSATVEENAQVNALLFQEQQHAVNTFVIITGCLSMYVSSQHPNLEQIRQIMTHPFFTGECPECKHKLKLVDRVIGQSRCPMCGWTDEADA